MKSPKFFGTPKSKLFYVRRVVGTSMQPNLLPGRLVVVTRAYRPLKVGQIVMLNHRGLDKIKRIQAVEDQKVFLVGDNPDQSIDSRHFGWIDRDKVVGRLIWPRVI